MLYQRLQNLFLKILYPSIPAVGEKRIYEGGMYWKI